LIVSWSRVSTDHTTDYPADRRTSSAKVTIYRMYCSPRPTNHILYYSFVNKRSYLKCYQRKKMQVFLKLKSL